MIYGIQKLSLVDYPSLPSFVIFLGGCNFRCPFCHNSRIVNKTETTYEIDKVLEEIKKRRAFLNGVVVTGGEPTLYGEKLIDLLKKIRELHVQIKLDTNGTNPNLLKKIIDLDLVDYIAMDIKNTWEKYEQTIGCKVDIEKMKQSIQLIENSNKNYEFRMTINKTMHTKEDILTTQNYVKDKKRFFLQPYKYQPTQIVNQDFKEFTKEEIKELEDAFFIKA
ncbi:MAG: anaerobic ribonucleoside-triphosphate reductase activating protein [Bacilli bacterium]|nr:anaerobic ribonucleoside-triphosphate reductase activating protein [Bacilli bacterium]